MRIFSRIGSWLRAKNSGEEGVDPPLQSGRELPLLDHETLSRLPCVSADLFRQRLLDAIRAAHDEARVQIATLDPAVRVLVMSEQPHGNSDEDIDVALRQVEAGSQNLSSVTWSALRDARPPFRPAPAQWGGNLAHHLDGHAGLIFFVDVEAIAIAVVQAAEAQGLSGHYEEDGGLVRVSDGRFHAHVGTSAIIAEALWTGTGPLAVVLKRAQQLPNEMRSFVAILRGLERRFPGVRFDVGGDHLLARTASQAAPRPIDYRHLAAGARASHSAVDAFLKGARLDDLAEQSGEVAMFVRAPSYKKAYPNVVCAAHDGSLLVAVREENGRACAVRAHDDDPPERFEFLQAEARRQLPFMRFDGHAFIVEQSARQGALAPGAYGFVGDKAASLLLDPPLVRGFCEQLGPVPPAVDVVTLSENALIVIAPGTSLSVIEAARQRASRLEVDLFDDSADALLLTRHIELPAVGGGCFELTIVPDDFFALSQQAIESGTVGRVHADYLRGLALESIGLTAIAASAFERAVRARSDDGQLNLALGRALSTMGEHTRALSILQRAAAALPEHAEVQNALGQALYQTGAVGDARLAFMCAVKLAPEEVGFLVNLGRSCCDERLYGEAMTALEHALRVEPASAQAHASMAVLCHRTGERRRALHHARAALAEQPDDDRVRELLQMMDEDV